LVLIQAGTLQMGSNDGENDEKPAHTVRLVTLRVLVWETMWLRYASQCVPSHRDGQFSPE